MRKIFFSRVFHIHLDELYASLLLNIFYIFYIVVVWTEEETPKIKDIFIKMKYALEVKKTWDTCLPSGEV